jgi:hypothetical protein
MVSDETQQLINNMSREELLDEINKENRSRFQGENYSYLKTRFAILETQDETQHKQRALELAVAANRLAAEANEISSSASTTAKQSYRMSALAVVVALASAFIALASQCTTKW